MKQTKIINLFDNEDFLMNLLAGAYDEKIQKGKMKIEPVYGNKKSVEPIEVETIDEVLAPIDELGPVEVDTIEEVLGIKPKVEPVIDEEGISAPKCTNIELAIAVLDGSCTDMDSEDFEPEVWAEANELYYSMDDVGRTEEKELGVGTVMSFSNKRLGDFFNDRINTIESWESDEGTEGYIGAEIEEYVYEDDEVNVSEACDATILSFAKAFDCMKARAA